MVSGTTNFSLGEVGKVISIRVLRAVDDTCTHVGGSLSDGPCDGGVVTCPLHGARFRLSDGQGLGPPAYRRLETYPVTVVDGLIRVAVPLL